jgi:hypothetical protein
MNRIYMIRNLSYRLRKCIKKLLHISSIRNWHNQEYSTLVMKNRKICVKGDFSYTEKLSSTACPDIIQGFVGSQGRDTLAWPNW